MGVNLDKWVDYGDSYKLQYAQLAYVFGVYKCSIYTMVGYGTIPKPDGNAKVARSFGGESKVRAVNTWSLGLLRTFKDK